MRTAAWENIFASHILIIFGVPLYVPRETQEQCLVGLHLEQMQSEIRLTIVCKKLTYGPQVQCQHAHRR